MEYFILVDKNERILSNSFKNSENYVMLNKFSPNSVIFDNSLYNLLLEKCPVLKDSKDNCIIIKELNKREIKIKKNFEDNTNWVYEIKKIKYCPQRQDSTIDQLIDLMEISDKLGFIKVTIFITGVCDNYINNPRIESFSTPAWKKELKKITQCPENVSDLNQQLKYFHHIANKFGFYDAADFLKRYQ